MEISRFGGKGDCWELTNFGNTAVALGNCKWGDDKGDPNAADVATIPAGTSIAAGESMLFALSDPQRIGGLSMGYWQWQHGCHCGRGDGSLLCKQGKFQRQRQRLRD